MHRLCILLTTALLFAATSAAVFAQGVEPGQSFTGKVAEVTDGDTFKLRRAVALCRRFRPHGAAFSGAFSFALGPPTEMIWAPHTEKTAYKKLHTSNIPRRRTYPPRGIAPHTEKIWAPSTEILPAPFSFAWRRV